MLTGNQPTLFFFLLFTPNGLMSSNHSSEVTLASYYPSLPVYTYRLLLPLILFQFLYPDITHFSES